MDCASPGGLNESVLAGNRTNTAPTHCSNGQKSKRSSSPGPHPVKTSCVTAQSPKLRLNITNSPKKGLNMPSDVEMLSPDSPVSKTTLVNNSADRDHDGSASTEHCGSAKAQVMETQQFVKDDSGCSAKDRVHPLSMVNEDAEIAECSGSSEMSLDLTGSQSSALFERYLWALLQPFVSSVSLSWLGLLLFVTYWPLVWSVSFTLLLYAPRWLGTPIDELNRMPQCAPPLTHLKVAPSHTITVRVSHQLSDPSDFYMRYERNSRRKASVVGHHRTDLFLFVLTRENKIGNRGTENQRRPQAVGGRQTETVVGRVKSSSMIPSGFLVRKAPIRLRPPFSVPQEHCHRCHPSLLSSSKSPVDKIFFVFYVLKNYI